jgi:hypothetical protein
MNSRWFHPALPCTLCLPALILAVLGGDATAQSHLYTFRGENPQRRLGHSVSAAGDLNHDGFADLIVGIPGNASTTTFAGSARIRSGRDGRVLLTVSGRAPGDQFGWSVSRAGDVDLDGFPDFVVGAPGRPTLGSGPGYVRVVSGRTGDPLLTVNGKEDGDLFGWSVAGAGDVDRDGRPDIVVGAPLAGSDTEGTVTVISGRDGRELHVFFGVGALDYFGWSVCGPGDVDGDGYDDVVVGAPGQGLPPSRAYVRVFSGLDGSVLMSHESWEFTPTGTVDGHYFGVSVAGAGDFDGDERPEFLVGSPGRDAAEWGFVALIGMNSSETLLPDTGGFPAYGGAVSALGDVNGDHVPEIIVGAPADDQNGPYSGSVWIMGGDGSVVLWSRQTSVPGEGLGASVAGVGDVNGDGVPDACFGGTQSLTGDVGYVSIYSSRHLALTSDSHAISLRSGGAQILRLQANPDDAGKAFHILGSLSGTTPGVPIGGGLVLPLNLDPYLWLTAAHPDLAPVSPSVGWLDASSHAAAAFILPRGLPASLAGTTLHHAFVRFGPEIEFVSNAVPLLLTP